MNYQKLFEIKKVQLRAQKFNNLTNIKSLYFFIDRKKIHDLKQVLKNLPKKTCLIFREYDLPKQEREELALKYFKISKEFGHDFLVGKDINLAVKIKCDGVHFSDNDLTKSLLKIRYSCKKNKLIFSFALHNLKNLSYLRILSPDMVFLSPIFKTSSHQNQRPLGLFNYLKISKIFNQKISKNNFFPLGGINLQNLRRLNKINITGFGAIDFFKNL
jgi:thiamine-phosphate pyrophosphorylase